VRELVVRCPRQEAEGPRRIRESSASRGARPGVDNARYFLGRGTVVEKPPVVPIPRFKTGSALSPRRYCKYSALHPGCGASRPLLAGTARRVDSGGRGAPCRRAQRDSGVTPRASFGKGDCSRETTCSTNTALQNKKRFVTPQVVHVHCSASGLRGLSASSRECRGVEAEGPPTVARSATRG
jgi:hypothetical protein